MPISQFSARCTTSLVLILMMIFRPGGLLGSYDFSMSRLVERVLFGKKKKEGADHE